jgi:glycosyltransferase involved in cell wall biosynthesis
MNLQITASRAPVFTSFPCSLRNSNRILTPAFRLPKGGIPVVTRLFNLKGVRLLLNPMPLAAAKVGRSNSQWLVRDRTALHSRDLLRSAAYVCALRLASDALDADMRQSDLLAIPSLWPEPFGLVGIEAACRGLPSVTFDLGGISEWLRRGYTGELAPGDPPTAQVLADAIVRAFINPQHHYRLRQGAWETANRFGLARALDRSRVRIR